jgi:hypothetical protein
MNVSFPKVLGCPITGIVAEVAAPLSPVLPENPEPEEIR